MLKDLLTRKVNVGWDSISPTVLLNLETGEVVVINYRTIQEMIEKYDGEITYVSNSTLTGDGYLYLPYTYTIVGSYRRDRRGNIIDVFGKRKTELDIGDYRYGNIFVELENQEPTGNVVLKGEINCEEVVFVIDLNHLKEFLKLIIENEYSDFILDKINDKLNKKYILNNSLKKKVIKYLEIIESNIEEVEKEIYTNMYKMDAVSFTDLDLSKVGDSYREFGFLTNCMYLTNGFRRFLVFFRWFDERFSDYDDRMLIYRIIDIDEVNEELYKDKNVVIRNKGNVKEIYVTSKDYIEKLEINKEDFDKVKYGRLFIRNISTKILSGKTMDNILNQIEMEEYELKDFRRFE